MLLAALAGSLPQPAAAQRVQDLRAGERLSDWLLRQDLAQAYPPGLLLSRESERAAQEQLRSSTIALLQGEARWQGLVMRLRELPLSGRVLLAVPDARWLQGNPAQDPVLLAGDRLFLPSRPLSVTVLMSDGRLCQPQHRAGAHAAHYLAACDEQAAGVLRQQAWVVQPDGRVWSVGTAPWNAHVQPQPAPGAWIWATGRDADPGIAASSGIARVLSAHGLARDLPAAASDVLRPAVGLAPGFGWHAPRDAGVSANDWGEIGLMQTPSARMATAGTMRFHFSRVQPYKRGTLMLQPFDWLEGGFRYTDVANRLYGPDIAGTQSYKDKSIDFKVRLLQEGPLQPAVALGMRDIGGTGLFSGEYLVASKRHADLDFSLGLGWGYLGARGDVRNPLSALDRRFDTRPPSSNPSGGTINATSLFRGPTALFGGVQWRLPERAIWLKAEIEGNDYRSEPQANVQRQTTPLNLGVVWRPAPGYDLSLGLERGQKLMFGLSLTSELATQAVPKVLDPPLPRAVAASAASAAVASVDAVSLARQVALHTDWRLDEFSVQGSTLLVRIVDAAGAYRRERLERLVAVLDGLAPASVAKFVIGLGQIGLDDLSTWEVDRRRLAALRVAPSFQGQANAAIRPLQSLQAPAASSWRRSPWGFEGQIGPTFSYIIGGPDGFLLYDLGLGSSGRQQLGGATWLSYSVKARLVDNFDRFKYTAPSDLPRVRTFQREYVTTRRVTLPRLQLNHVGRLGQDQFYNLYGGMLEPMFAGVGAEWGWRPRGSALGLFVDLNRVRQRAFEQDLRTRDYEVSTGHATLVWNTGWSGVVASLSAGQYLAGDRGATLELSRVFANGVAMGAFATKTNVSSAVFGEGSFDKGIFITLPIDAIFPRSSKGDIKLLWRPLTRDGGAMLARSSTLRELTDLHDNRVFEFGSLRPQGERRFGDPPLAP